MKQDADLSHIRLHLHLLFTLGVNTDRLGNLLSLFLSISLILTFSPHALSTQLPDGETEEETDM